MSVSRAFGRLALPMKFHAKCLNRWTYVVIERTFGSIVGAKRQRNKEYMGAVFVLDIVFVLNVVHTGHCLV